MPDGLVTGDAAASQRGAGARGVAIDDRRPWGFGQHLIQPVADRLRVPQRPDYEIPVLSDSDEICVRANRQTRSTARIRQHQNGRLLEGGPVDVDFLGHSFEPLSNVGPLCPLGQVGIRQALLSSALKAAAKIGALVGIVSRTVRMNQR